MIQNKFNFKGDKIMQENTEEKTEKATKETAEKTSLVFHESPFHATHDAETANKMAAAVDAEIKHEQDAVAINVDDAAFVSDVAKIIGEPAAVFVDNESEVIEVVTDDCGFYADPLHLIKKQSADALYNHLIGETRSYDYDLAVTIINLIADGEIPHVKFVI